MSLNMAFFERDTNIQAKVLADSISLDGQRFTTFEVEAPRIVLAETNTHHAIVKNCSSTRAITIAKAIQQIEENGFEPVYWGKKQTGMSAKEELSGVRLELAGSYWKQAKRNAIRMVEALDGIEAHKQIAGRLLEPFQMVKQVLSATDLDNFFNLRIHPDAQPEILMLAYKMYKALQASTPNRLRVGEWHLPYVEIFQDQNPEETYYHVWNIDTTGTETDGYCFEQRLTLEEAQRISASCCAQVSYRNTDGSLEKADTIFDRLIHADVLHASPFEHLATPIQETRANMSVATSVNIPVLPNTWEKGITHFRKDGRFGSGSLAGWISYRHLMENNTCWKFDFDERMKLFA